MFLHVQNVRINELFLLHSAFLIEYNFNETVKIHLSLCYLYQTCSATSGLANGIMFQISHGTTSPQTYGRFQYTLQLWYLCSLLYSAIKRHISTPHRILLVILASDHCIRVNENDSPFVWRSSLGNVLLLVWLYRQFR